VRRDPLQIHGRTDSNASLSLSQLPALGRRSVSSFVILPTEAFKLLRGAPRFHASPSEAGGMTRRGFCPECGSPVYGKPDAVPQFVAIRTASLDDPGWFNSQMDVWTSDAHQWDQMNPALPKFEKYPPSGD